MRQAARVPCETINRSLIAAIAREMLKDDARGGGGWLRHLPTVHQLPDPPSPIVIVAQMLDCPNQNCARTGHRSSLKRR